jgi:MarR family transcriptional regulator, 2-MHQ and catechol-resistance regulon repressor
MGIEKEIHQQAFRNNRQKAIINLLYTYGWVIEKIKNILAKEDITHQQYNILRILRGAHPEPLSTLQIRERMLDKMSDTSRIVDRLIVKDLVKKSTCPKDKRLVDVLITEKGQELLQKLDARSEDMDSIVSGITEDEAAALSQLLDKLRGANSSDASPFSQVISE